MSGVKTEIDLAFDYFSDSTIVNGWVDDNPGEYEAIEAYRRSDGPAPTTIETAFGNGLLAVVKAGKYGDGRYQS